MVGKGSRGPVGEEARLVGRRPLKTRKENSERQTKSETKVHGMEISCTRGAKRRQWAAAGGIALEKADGAKVR